MDNASKALIIAGAVLIAVMLVSVGVLIYNQAAGIIGTGQEKMNATEVRLANSTYQQYAGTGKNRETVASLLEEIAQGYKSNSEHTVKVTIKKAAGSSATLTSGASLTGVTSEGSITTAAKEIRKMNNTRFDISFDTDQNGYIDSCTIEAQR